MRPRGNHDDASALCGQERRQPVDQHEMPEVICGELRLPARSDPRFGTGHDAGRGDQHVDWPPSGQNAIREIPDAVEIAQIEFCHRDTVAPVKRRARRFDSACPDQHFGAGRRERPDRLLAEPGGPTGDKRIAPAEVDAGQHVIGRAIPVKAGRKRFLVGHHDLTSP